MTFFESAEVTSMIIAFISLAGVCFTAYMTYVTKRDTRQINRSVNHIQPGEKRLYELAMEASFQLNHLCGRVGNVEDKLDAHIASDQRCPLLDDCAETLRKKRQQPLDTPHFV